MNYPVDPKQLALLKREARALRVKRIRGSVAALGTILAIAFSTVVMQRQSGATANAQVSGTTVASTQSTSAPLPTVVQGTSIVPGSTGPVAPTTTLTTQSAPVVTQSAPLVTSQS